MATETLTFTRTTLEPYYSQGLRERYRLDGLKPIKDNIASQSIANIHFEFDESKYKALAHARLCAGGLEVDVPAGWPNALHGPLVWTGENFDHADEYVIRLSDDDKIEIQQALDYLNKLGLDGDEVNCDRFPLPHLGKLLEKAAEDIYNGRGFIIVRGLDPDDFSIEDSTIVYLGLSSYIAERRGRQDQRGSMLMHVMRDFAGERNIEYKGGASIIASAWTVYNELLHGQCTTSFCMDSVQRASAWTVYNELAATRPDLIHVLAKPDWPFDTFGRDPPYYKRALMYCQDGKIITNFARRLLVGHPPEDPRTNGIPTLSEAQAEALDAIHFIARKHELRPRMERGDIRFVNNMAVLHRREAFEDDPDSKCHLIRLWLNNEAMCWKLPPPLRLAWARVFDDTERRGYWDLEPLRKDGKLLSVAGSCG